MTTEELKNNAKKTTTNATKTPPKPSSDQKPKPVKTFRRGAVAASVWHRQTGTGFAYYEFSLSRSWKSTTSGKEGYSTNFFPQNGEGLAEVIQEAGDWIVEQMAGAVDPAKETVPDVRRAA